MSSFTNCLNDKLADLLKDPLLFSNACQFIDRLHTENPCKADGSKPPPSTKDAQVDRWCFQDGSVVTFKFAAGFQRSGNGTRINEYFNATNTKGDTKIYSKKLLEHLQAVFEIQPLSENDCLAEFYPEGTIEASNVVPPILLHLQGELAQKRPGVYPSNITSPIRKKPDKDVFTMMLTSHPLLPTLKCGIDNFPSVMLSLDDLADIGTLSPSKLKATASKRKGTGNLADTDDNDNDLTLGPMPDPEDLYAEFPDALDAKIKLPKVFNGKGNLVPPQDYSSLPWDAVVIVEASLCCWQFKSDNKDKRVTHMHLKTLQLLDKSMEQANNIQPSGTQTGRSKAVTSKGKRKAGPDSNDSKTKKLRTRSNLSSGSSSTAKDDHEQEETGGDQEQMDEDSDDL
ncbi:hypothetical protein FA15DRAFT_706653 [Coprinopsis marcescibilis]|uniref:Uncharacterized protein n=1 Tax=Coprinopsis marcescibilis TaxID=230819 RepID=A0A5C3KPB9_COPMA|nr:hypothetical protein FA15DRAFT_706653 [Coprinopsis marcescibilis]